MPPSQVERQPEQTLEQEYNHKKFNCGYSHKKLGMRLKKRQEEIKENVEIVSQSQPTEENKTPKHKKKLFRPYALDDNTPRKRKMSRASKSSDEEKKKTSNMNSAQSSPVLYHHLVQQPPAPVLTSSPFPIQTCASPVLSPNTYYLHLQSQRAALYTRYMSQFQQLQLQTPAHYATMGYPNVTAPIFNRY